MKRYICCSKSSEAAFELTEAPKPFDKYYEAKSDEEMQDIIGEDFSDHPVDSLIDYDLKHVSWLLAKDRYLEALMDDGLDICELAVDADGNLLLVQTIGSSAVEISIADIRRCINRRR